MGLGWLCKVARFFRIDCSGIKDPPRTALRYVGREASREMGVVATVEADSKMNSPGGNAKDVVTGDACALIYSRRRAAFLARRERMSSHARSQVTVAGGSAAIEGK